MSILRTFYIIGIIVTGIFTYITAKEAGCFDDIDNNGVLAGVLVGLFSLAVCWPVTITGYLVALISAKK